MSTPFEPFYLHASALDMAPDCFRRFAATALRREITAAGWVVRDAVSGISAVIGTAVHYSAEVVMEERAEKGTLPPPSVATDAARDKLREQLAESDVAFDGGTYPTTPSESVAESQALRMALSYRHDIAPYREPRFVEKRFEAPVGNVRQEIVLTGRPDLVTVEPNEISDLKTGKIQPKTIIQPGAYSLILRTPGAAVPEGLRIDRVKIDWIKRESIKKAQPRPVEYPPPIAVAEKMAIEVIGQLDTQITAFREGDPIHGLEPGDPAAFPTNVNSNLCGERYCRCFGVKGPNAFCHAWQAKPPKGIAA